MALTRSYYEAFAKFLEQPTRVAFRLFLQNQVGELRNGDFKVQWSEHSALSKHVLGMANNGGGCLVIGVEEQPDKTLKPVGMSALAEKADISNGIKRYIPPDLLRMIGITEFSFDASEYAQIQGMKFKSCL